MLNKVFLIGNVGKDAEVVQVGSSSVAKFSLATKETWRDRDGNKKEATEWHNVEVWGKQADAIGKWIEKGRLVSIEGKIMTQSWGEPKKYKTVIRASEITFLTKGEERGGRGHSDDEGGGRRGGRREREYEDIPNGDSDGGSMFPDDDIPF